MFKLIVGFGGIAVVLIAEWLLFRQPVTRRHLAAIQRRPLRRGSLTPQITNGLVRDLLMTLMVGHRRMFGVVDVVQKPEGGRGRKRTGPHLATDRPTNNEGALVFRGLLFARKTRVGRGGISGLA